MLSPVPGPTSESVPAHSRPRRRAPSTAGSMASQSTRVVHQVEQIDAVALLARRPVAGSRGVAPVGGTGRR